MRHVSLLLLGIVAALALPLSSRAAFEGDFVLVDDLTPAGLYDFDSGVATLGAWNVGFFPSDNGDTFVNTTGAPSCVTLGSETGFVEEYEESTTVLFIDMPEDGHVSFTVQVNNQGDGSFSSAFEIYLSGEALYFLTDEGVTTYTLGFDVFTGDTLEFRSVSLSAGTASFATNTSTVSNFVYVAASAIPEPATFASLLGLGALGFAGRRRRASSSS